MTTAQVEYQQSERYTNKERSYRMGDESERQMIADLAGMSFDSKSFLDEGWLCDFDRLPAGSRIAILLERNPEKEKSPFPIDHLIHFYQEQRNGEWIKVKTALCDQKERRDPRYLIHKAYAEAKKTNPTIPEFHFYETVGLDEGNEKRGREYANYLKRALETGEDVYLLYAINYEKGKEKFGKVIPETNQSLLLTSTLRVNEADKAGLLVKTQCSRTTRSGVKYFEDVNQLPFPLILPSGKPLFQKVISNYVISEK